MLPEFEAEFYAIDQNRTESVEDHFYRLYSSYEKVTQQQGMLNLHVMKEETARDRFISQLYDVTIQRLFEEKVIDNPELSILAASAYALNMANERPQPKMNIDTSNVGAFIRSFNRCFLPGCTPQHSCFLRGCPTQHSRF